MATRMAGPKCLWVTWMDPRGGRGGEFLYSSGLIGALSQAGADIEVLCHDSEDTAAGETSNVAWHSVPAPPRASTWHSLLSSLPNVAWRSSRGGARQALAAQLQRDGWDVLVIDALHAGWALAPILEDSAKRTAPKRPRLVYIAHNHEQSTRRRVAAGAHGNPLRRLGLAIDAEKAAALERRLVDEADLVTAITEQDAARFRAQRRGRPVTVLTPGYDGPRRGGAITADTPRRAVMLGSFHWVAKRMNLERFLAVADPIFAAAGAELRIVGDGPAEMFPRLRKRCTATCFTGPVDNVAPHIAGARIALVPEEAGGGFKLKALDYVFNRLPIAALAGSVAGTPLKPPDAMLEFSSLQELARGAVAAMEDCARLNRIQERAFKSCADRFDWTARGTDLCRAIAELP